MFRAINLPPAVRTGGVDHKFSKRNYYSFTLIVPSRQGLGSRIVAVAGLETCCLWVSTLGWSGGEVRFDCSMPAGEHCLSLATCCFTISLYTVICHRVVVCVCFFICY